MGEDKERERERERREEKGYLQLKINRKEREIGERLGEKERESKLFLVTFCEKGNSWFAVFFGP